MWQGYENEGYMPGDRDRIARASRNLKRLADPVATERSRLESEVIEAAKEWPANYEREELLRDSLGLRLFDAAQALIEFESQNAETNRR